MDEENTSMEDACGEEFVCGDPKVDIRVGDEYQTEIPPMLCESERVAYLLNPLASDLESHAIVVGLPVDITWIDTKLKDDNVDMSESLKSLKTKRNRRVESDKNRGSSKHLEAVPERSSSSWEDLEVDGFVLGLYTFGKNFTQVKKFLESKETGELLSFYYGKFYKSTKHKIWSNSLKKRSRKCIQGKKLYSGWRLHQLLSRLIPSITDESQKTKLVNVSKSFAEGNTSLEKYISAVKELVGLRSLVEAVAIGKGKDLTVLTTEPVKSKQWFTVSSAVPAGLGVYSSLTCDEIIEKLSGGSRLSKARCNDIFWEAVWPRLLARGWHSEQPKDRGYIKSKDSNIVFLIPGVKKFSRRKLVKQNHYFDSISDIIKKVVSDPELLEFEADEIRPSNGIMEENDNHDQSKQEKRRYLKSPDSSSSTHMKFTVVDTTSLASGGKLCAFRELKNPNPESKACQGDNNFCVDVEKHIKFGKECKWEKRRMKKLVEEPARFMIVDTSGGQSSGIRRRRRLPANENLCKAFGDPSSSQNQSGTNTGVTWELTGSGVKEENVRSKKRSVRKSESVNNHSLGSFPLPKRRRLSACVRKDIERFGESSVDFVNIKTEKAEEAGDGTEILRPKTEPSELCSIDMQCSSKKQEALQEASSSEKQEEESSKQLCCSKDLEEKLIQPPSMSGSDQRNSPSTGHGTTQETVSIKQEEEEEEEEEQNQQINTDPPRRQSTRKRPLTTRALEALESGFYTAKTLKSTPKPIKRERSARIKHSVNASNKAQGEADNGFLVKETTSSNPLDRTECSEPSFLADKATTASKPVDQTEDSNQETTEFPKRPPILLKLPFKRG